jgi:hypothetical protein
MTCGEERDHRTGLLSWAQDARVRSAAYAARAGRAAESAAAIGIEVDRMIERVAGLNPEYAERLQAIIVTATDQRAAIAEQKRSYAAGRPGGRLIPRARNELDAAALAEREGPLRDIAIAQDEDRTAGEFRDKVVQGVFTAGLTLQDAVELTAEPEVRWRIEAAVDDLDELIRVIRGELFDPSERLPCRDPDSSPDDVTSPASG